MNVFYCPPSRISSDSAEFTEEEARHASKVLRYREGDDICFVDGVGGWYEGTVGRILKRSLTGRITSRRKMPDSTPRLTLGMGIIKKRDRLEFAVEKATELGAGKIALFRSRHTVKEKVRKERLEKTALSAMKQSMRSRLPEIEVHPSLDHLLESCRAARILAAHEKAEDGPVDTAGSDELLLLVGPEGGFSDPEIEQIREKGGKRVSLGMYRLRTETAALVFLSRFLR